MMPEIRAWSLKSLILGAALACGGGGGGGGGGITPPPPPSGSATVSMGATTFSPTTVTITRGGTVTWTNSSGVTHNVTFAAAAGAPANIGNHASGSNQRTFSTAGTFNYSCTLHPPSMNGVVNVQ